MAPKNRSASKKGKSRDDDEVVTSKISDEPIDSKEEQPSASDAASTTDSKTVDNKNKDPVLVIFKDKSTMLYFGDAQDADNIYNTAVEQICEGTLEELTKFQKFANKMQQPVYGLSLAEAIYSKEKKPKPAIVKFDDGSAFVHFLGIDYMKQQLATVDNDSYKKVEFEEDDDFERLEKLATAYNQIAAVRCDSPNEIKAVQAAPDIFNKLVPTSTCTYVSIFIFFGIINADLTDCLSVDLIRFILPKKQKKRPSMSKNV
jgi:hypothetical protein